MSWLYSESSKFFESIKHFLYSVYLNVFVTVTAHITELFFSIALSQISPPVKHSSVGSKNNFTFWEICCFPFVPELVEKIDTTLMLVC